MNNNNLNTKKLVNDKTIEKIVGGFKQQHYDYVPEYGERAWKAIGKDKDLVLWDCGNAWYKIIKIILKTPKR